LRREDPFLTCDEEVHAVVYDSERAEPVCIKCGLVLDEMKLDFLIDLNAVPRRRTSCPRADRTPKRSLKHPSLERTLRDTFLKKSIEKVVQDKTLELCHAVSKKRFSAGYPVSTLSSAMVYTAHRLVRVPVTLTECAATSATERKRVARCYEKLCKELELNVPRFESADYLPHLAKKKKIHDNTMAFARKILERAREKRLVRGANPMGIAAAAVYVAGNVTGHRITQKDLASVAGVSEVTVRVNCKILSSLLQTLPVVNKEFK
jgi:transcription initiation factor TFIIB